MVGRMDWERSAVVTHRQIIYVAPPMICPIRVASVSPRRRCHGRPTVRLWCARIFWREHAVLDGGGLRKLPEDLQWLSLGLGMVGQSAATALVELLVLSGGNIGKCAWAQPPREPTAGRVLGEPAECKW
jgi:hypothetical protein